MDSEKGVFLLVDDDPTNRDILLRRLERSGHRVECAGDGHEALALLEKHAFDLVLLDIVMPGMGGLETLRAIREKHTTLQLPVIMVTVHDDSSEIVRALDMGANDYVTKPVDFPVAMARLRTHLLVKRAMDALEEVNERLHRLATIDSLTGIANRRRFDEVLDSEWKRAIRDAQSIAVLMLDVDHFKSFNDTYGHEFGDTVLKQVAATLNNSVRPGDFVARYGGEEFAVVLPSTDASAALAVAERMRRAVELAELEHQGKKSGRVTISIGVASSVARREAAPQPLIAQADGALYAAKHAGRNAVRLATPPGAEPE